jgi:hypothetical protein
MALPGARGVPRLVKGFNWLQDKDLTRWSWPCQIPYCPPFKTGYWYTGHAGFALEKVSLPAHLDWSPNEIPEFRIWFPVVRSLHPVVRDDESWISRIPARRRASPRIYHLSRESFLSPHRETVDESRPPDWRRAARSFRRCSIRWRCSFFSLR